MAEATSRIDATPARNRVPWTDAATVAVGTSLLFLVVYGGAAYLTSLRSDVGTWYYDWERFIPFVPVMIVPYMSIDVFFFFAPFLCRDREELRVLTQRLSAVVVVAAFCFLIYPLQLAVERPVAEGSFGSIYKCTRSTAFLGGRRKLAGRDMHSCTQARPSCSSCLCSGCRSLVG